MTAIHAVVAASRRNNLEIVEGEGFQAEVVRINRRRTATVKVEEGKVSVVVPRRTSKRSV